MKSSLLFPLFFACFLSSLARAQNMTFDDLTEVSFENIVREFSANFTHTSVSGASSLGKIFGFELGLVGGSTKTPDIERLVHAEDPKAKADKIYHAGILGIFSFPLGLTAEANFIPAIGSDEFKFKTLGLALKWTLTETILSSLPLSLALRGHMKNTDLSFTQKVDSDPYQSTIEFEDKVTGADLIVSKNLLIVEPYVGYGMVTGKGTMTVTGTSSSIFAPSYTSSASASATEKSSHFFVGTELKLLFFKAGVEYAKLFGTSRVSGKLAFYF